MVPFAGQFPTLENGRSGAARQPGDLEREAASDEWSPGRISRKTELTAGPSRDVGATDFVLGGQGEADPAPKPHP